MKKDKVAYALLVGALALATMAFQNCAPVNFTKDAASTQAVVSNGDVEPTPDPDPTATPTATPRPPTPTATAMPTATPLPGSLTVTAAPPSAIDPYYELTTISANITTLSYTCKTVLNGTTFASGNLAVGSVTTPVKNVVEDLNCTVVADAGTSKSITRTVALTVDCESQGQLKNSTTHRCEEFQCQQIVALTPAADGTLDVPARTTAGICYSVKLMNAIANSASTLTSTVDNEFISRNHQITSTDPGDQRIPFLMGKSVLDFIMRKGGGARQVKLSGAGNSIAPILVDNFVAVGLAKRTIGLSSNKVYRSYGTADSTIDASNTYVQFRNQPLNLKSFGPGGTASVSALDITTEVSTEEYYSLDVRALDCGGSRELSNIYLLFQ